MLTPPLNTQAGYVDKAKAAGLKVLTEPKDISQDVKQTWSVDMPSQSSQSYYRTNPTGHVSRDITWSLIQKPSLWAFALSQGRDGIAFLQSFRAMRRGYANNNFRYAVMSFEK